MGNRQNEVLQHIVDCIIESVNLLAPNKIDPQTVQSIAERTVNRISSDFGGEVIYLSKNHFFLREQAHKKIYAEFNGRNQRELSKKHGLSMQWIYQIIKQQSEAEKAEHYYAFDFGENEE